MNDVSHYLFVYGTLLDGDNPYCAFLKENSGFYDVGKLRGKLYDIGNYPGAILSTAPEVFVHGSIFLICHPKATLKELDDYEGFGDDFSQPNEFVRELVEVATGETSLKCWVYLYNLPVSTFPEIKSGDYLKAKTTSI